MEQEYKLSIFDIMQDSTPAGRTSEDGSPAGDTIRKLILDNWEKYEKLSIYFDGIVQMTRPFCDEAFAKILEVRTLEEFNEKQGEYEFEVKEKSSKPKKSVRICRRDEPAFLFILLRAYFVLVIFETSSTTAWAKASATELSLPITILS